MIHILSEMFGWPSGNVLGNLIASAIWAAPALWHLHAKLNRQHRERMSRLKNHSDSEPPDAVH